MLVTTRWSHHPGKRQPRCGRIDACNLVVETFKFSTHPKLEAKIRARTVGRVHRLRVLSSVAVFCTGVDPVNRRAVADLDEVPLWSTSQAIPSPSLSRLSLI